jgi:hypothetical protein
MKLVGGGRYAAAGGDRRKRAKLTESDISKL